MAFKLKSDVSVSSPGESALTVLQAGTPLSEISDHHKAQLAPDHFRDEKDNTPKDWRSSEAQKKDEEQRKFLDHYVETHTQRVES